VLPESLAVIIRTAKSAKAERFMALWRLYLYDTLLKRLAQDVEDMASELGQFIQEEHAVWMRVVSRVSARVIAGRRMVRRHASLDVPTLGGPSRSRSHRL
jgi:hypothetical protein